MKQQSVVSAQFFAITHNPVGVPTHPRHHFQSHNLTTMKIN